MVRITFPTANARHVHIGAQYAPQHFETRKSDGTYMARLPVLSADADRLQRALLLTSKRR